MGICCLPQIIINFINGSSDGLSLGMILIWTLGDGCNIAGVFLTKAVSLLVGSSLLQTSCLHNLRHQQLHHSQQPEIADVCTAATNTSVHGVPVFNPGHTAQRSALLV